MQASAVLISFNTEAGYEVKSLTTMTLSFGLSTGSSRRERATMDVMDEFRIHCSSTSRPMKPVGPDKMTFILLHLLFNYITDKKFGYETREVYSLVVKWTIFGLGYLT